MESPKGPEEPESVINIVAIQPFLPKDINQTIDLNVIWLLLVHHKCVIDISTIQLEQDLHLSFP